MLILMSVFISKYLYFMDIDYAVIEILTIKFFQAGQKTCINREI